MKSSGSAAQPDVILMKRNHEYGGTKERREHGTKERREYGTKERREYGTKETRGAWHQRTLLENHNALRLHLTWSHIG